MAKHRAEEHEEEMGEGWLLPYADLLTLLLAVFIVLFASSKVDSDKFASIAASFSQYIMGEGQAIISPPITGSPDVNINYPYEVRTPPPPESTGDPGVDGNENLDPGTIALLDLQSEITRLLEDSGLIQDVLMMTDERGLVISLRNAVLFNSGSADIRVEYRDILVQMATALNHLDNYIRIEGHTDNVPITNSYRYIDNWDLSNARAASVVRMFIKDGSILPGRLVSCGYGEEKPVATNSTAEGRAQNRRIDIIVLNTKHDVLEERANFSTTAP